MPANLSLKQSYENQTPTLDWGFLTQLVSRDFSKTREVLTSEGLSLDVIRSLSISSPRTAEPYGRRVLYRDENFEVMLATWTKGAECAAHDHGFSKGVVWLVEGNFCETHYDLTSELTALGKVIARPADTLLNVTPGDIHSMVALDGGMSLHIYSPPIQEMKVFDAENRRTLIVADDCGAWVPTDKNQIVSEIEWP